MKLDTNLATINGSSRQPVFRENVNIFFSSTICKSPVNVHARLVPLALQVLPVFADPVEVVPLGEEDAGGALWTGHTLGNHYDKCMQPVFS